ncbi:hypothetical protein EMIHUDRAFT_229695 [Emiliania huxleyi CCMP1516]|uniref:Uncharacterized protein n=2 Tax=Emiliania huxleyi TaxID=2903 RepID=A0A0D3KCP8_EMIH1|nr:hypothetical protein EMIHUDRAFT_229695 [Emiliania huxleyi CCMP1516]EOD33533.1 hypothetical protein EMIHUDRAFT_229695 [Emiliania huxleyi CCMP1516]|eukprot:XP_005785962.1 hypothetical protein EMIHUDRAFT_229695 [Emiliania huxleyi CCMP1516]
MFARRVFIALLAASLGTAKACTAYAAGKGATKDGSVIVSHSDDGAGSSDHDLSDNATAWRPVWPDDEDWPRFVGKSRGSTYEPLPGQSLTKPAGFVKQVAHTYAYFDGNYAVQNEHQGAPNPVTSLTTRGTSVAPPPLVEGGGPAATSMAAVPWVMAATGWVVAAALFARRHRGSTAAAPATGGDYAAFR